MEFGWGGNPGYVKKEDQRVMDRQAPHCDQEVCRGRRMVAEKMFMTFVGTEVGPKWKETSTLACGSWLG